MEDEKKNEDVKQESEIILALKEEYEKRLADKDKIIKSLIASNSSKSKSKSSKSHEDEDEEDEDEEEKAKKEAEERRKKRIEYYKGHIY